MRSISRQARSGGLPSTISFVARSREPIWLALAGGLGGVGGVLLGISAAFGAVTRGYSTWTSVTASVAYTMFGLAVVCLASAAYEVPIRLPGRRSSAGPSTGSGPSSADPSAPVMTWEHDVGAERTVQTVRECNPFDLGVHRALPPPGAMSLADGPEVLTPYLERDHDKELSTVLRSAAASGPSVFAVLSGDSSTGKTRALYHALREITPDWPLLRPADADDLLGLLSEGRFRAGTVLWLNETQRHLYDTSGERAATLLRSALAATCGAVAVGALWSRPYIAELTAGGISPDVHAAARELLNGPRTHRISVLDRLDGHQQRDLAALAGSDERIAAALAASRLDGNVIQHLTGGPELLSAYTGGGLFTHIEGALITAALDARRLGHEGPIPAALLAAAADGYLSPRQRPGHVGWATYVLTGLATGARSDGTRTDIRNTLTALKPVRARSGDTETGYEPDDYLDQQTRRLRQTCLGPRQLWDALAEHTTSYDDLFRLAGAAHSRGLYRYAALLWKQAIALGDNSYVASRFIELLRAVDRDGVNHAASWVADHVPIDEPRHIGSLLYVLRAAGAQEAVTSLAARAAGYVAFEDSRRVALLLDVLRTAGAQEAVMALLARYPADHVALDDPNGVAELLVALHRIEAGEAVTALAARAASNVALDDPNDVASLLRALLFAEANEAVTALLARHPADHVAHDDPWGVASLLEALRAAGTQETVTALAARAASNVALDDPRGAASLLEALSAADAQEAITMVATRVSSEVALDNPSDVAELLWALRLAGAKEAATALAARAASDVGLDDSGRVASVLAALRRAGAQEAVTALLARHPADHVALDDPTGFARLLNMLRTAGAPEAATALAARAASDVGLDDPGRVASLLAALRRADAQEAVTALLARHPADHVAVDNPDHVYSLLNMLRAAGVPEAATALAARAASNVGLDDPGRVASLLWVLYLAGAPEAVTALLARHPADHVALDDRSGVGELLEALDVAAAQEATAALATRAVNAGLPHGGPFSVPIFGREPDGAASQPWSWQDPTQAGRLLLPVRAVLCSRCHRRIPAGDGDTKPVRG